METQSTEEEKPAPVLPAEPETPVPENPPHVEIPVLQTSVSENPSPIHQRAATIDFHDFSLNTENPKTEEPVPVLDPVPVPVTDPEPKMTRSNSVPSDSLNPNFPSSHSSSNNLSEEKETNRFSDVSNYSSSVSMPVRLRVRDFKPEVLAGEPGVREKVDYRGPGVSRGFVERESRLESVKSVVSRFGGSVSWKAPRINDPNKSQMENQSSSTRLAMLEIEKIRRESAQLKMKSETMEASKAEILKELDHQSSVLEKLKLDLDQAETEESRAKQELLRLNKNLEMLKIFAQETEQGSKVDQVKSHHDQTINELKSVQEEINSLKEHLDVLNKEKEILVSKAEEAVCESKKVEKKTEELTEELNKVKKSLEVSSAKKMEAEEQKIGAGLAKDQDCITWKKEMREKQEELEKLEMQIVLAKDLDAKLENSRGLLEKLNAELAGLVEKKEREEEEKDKTEEIVESKQKEIKEIKEETEEIKENVNVLQNEVSSVKTELEKAKMKLENMKQREAMACIAVSSVETEIEKTEEQINISIRKEKEIKEKIAELPMLMKEADLETEKSKSIVKIAQEEAKKSKKESETVKYSLKTLEIKIHAVIKEIEAYKMSEKIALSAIEALKQSENEDNITEKVNISFDEYFSLSKRAHKAEQLNENRIITAFKEVENAKESENNTSTKLNEAYKELEEKKKVLLEAENKAIKAIEGKLAMEQELRQWRAEGELRRKSDSAIRDVIKTEELNNTEEISNKEMITNNNNSSGSRKSFEKLSVSKSFSTEGDSLVHVDQVYMTSPEGSEVKKEKKKKKSLFPRVIMFMAKKKAQKQLTDNSTS
ncbi:hypothetical protein LUZ60_005680 [Juncus effusus]|nr:hypothetical protein LUZ60_005680 [Juncus effusus]